MHRVDLVEGNIFNFWVSSPVFPETFKQCRVGAEAPNLGAVQILVYTVGAGLVIDCDSAGNWEVE